MKHIEHIHKANLEILSAIDEICKRHEIYYRIDSGTLLGAVRHRGFIPWDDDADVLFRREEFEKFKKYAVNELPDNMRLVMPNQYRGGKSFYDFVPRIIYLNSRRRKRKTREDSFYEGKLNHLWVDLFILDWLPDSPIKSFIYRTRQQLVFGLGMGHRLSIDYSKYSGIQKLEVGVLSSIGRMIPLSLIFILQDRWARACTDSVNRSGKLTGRSYFSNYQPDFQYCVVENKWEEPAVDFAFEGRIFPGPRGWDRILKMLYGDYMAMPPKKDRVPSHGTEEIEVF